MRSRRTVRVLVAAVVAPALAMGVASGAAATLPERETTSTTSPDVSAMDATLMSLLTAAVETTTTEAPADDPIDTVLDVASATEAEPDSGGHQIIMPSTSDLPTPIGDEPDPSPTINPQPALETLAALLERYLDPSVVPNVCPTSGAHSASCQHAYAVLSAVAPCVEPFLGDYGSNRSAFSCAPLVNATVDLLLLLAAEGVACANGETPLCKTALDAAVGATDALLRCVGVDPAAVTGGTRDSVVSGGGAIADTYTLCVQIVAAATAAAGQAIAAAQACADGTTTTCADLVATVVGVANGTLRCLAPMVPLTDTELGDGPGTSLLSFDTAAACEAVLLAARDILAKVTECARESDGTCYQTIQNAYATAMAIKADAETKATEAATCLGMGKDDAAGDVVAACRAVQERIKQALTVTGQQDCGEEVETLGDSATGDAEGAIVETDVVPDPLPPLPPAPDPDDPGYVTVWAGVDGVISDCAPSSVVVGGTAALTAEVVGLNGARIIQAAKDDPGGQDIDWNQWGLKRMPTRTYEWGKPVEGSKESESYGGHIMFFDTAQPNKHGRLMAWVQKVDVSIRAQADWKIMRAVSQFWHKNNRKTEIWDAAPLGSENHEKSEGASVNVGVQGTNESQTAGVEIGWSKTYGVEHTIFGGGKLRHDFNDGEGFRVYGTEGGYLKVAHCHRAAPRAWAQGLLVLLVKGAKQPKFGVRMYADIKSRKGDTAC